MIVRMVNGWLATFVCAGLALGCGSSQAEPGTAKAPPPKQARAPSTPEDQDSIPEGFQRVEDRALGFSVIMPVNAQRQKVEREGVAPGAWMWLGQSTEGSVYTIAYFGELELKEAEREEQLAEAVVGIVQGCQGKLISAKRGTAPWGDMVVFAGMCERGEPVFGRLHVQRGRMYAFFAIAKTAQAKESVRSFLHSFREIAQ